MPMDRSPFRLLVTDIDGTVCGPNQAISQETKRAVALLQARGIGVTVATGRNAWEAWSLVMELGITIPAILANGAQIYDFAAQRLLHGKGFCQKTLRAFLGSLAAPGSVEIHWFDGAAWRRSSLTEFGELQDLGLMQRVILSDPENTLDLADSPVCPYWIFRRGRLTELTPKEANKGAGLLILCSLLNIAPQEVVALGNDLNDLELIRTAGVGLAVVGGHPELLEAARAVTVPMECHPVEKIAQWLVGKTPWERIVMRR